jgi:phosphonate degradation associated HDIG domain protein
MSPTQEIEKILRTTGAKRYGAEAVNQLQHALQCATLAESYNAPSALITAALLHDIGHLVDNRAEGAAAQGIDRRHERIGSAYLKQWFGDDVVAPVALHVPAKRYLCAVDPSYFDSLSAASVRSLELQGGTFGKDQAHSFFERAYAPDAVLLRRWDEQSKDPYAKTPALDHFLYHVEAAALAIPTVAE